MEIRPLSSTHGAEVLGIDLRQPLSADTKAAIAQAYAASLLLVFRDQRLDKASQVRFSRLFGEFELPINRDYLGKDLPEVHVVSNLNGEGKPTRTDALANPGNYFWHTDASYMQLPASSTLLYAVQIPPRGGDTCFANMYAAYEALPAETKQRIRGMRAVHSWAQSRLNSGSRPATKEEQSKAPPVAHPMVRTHPDTGRLGLYLGIHTSHVEGMDVAAGRSLLKELLEHATQERFVYRHRWRAGDLVMWDNRCLLHKATDDYEMDSEPRLLHRTVLQGTAPA
jgi:taurine dioxygenase